MQQIMISLPNVEKAKSFVSTVSQFPFDFELSSGHYVIDAKSIMGVLSLDTSKPLALTIHTDENIETVMELLKPFLMESKS